MSSEICKLPRCHMVQQISADIMHHALWSKHMPFSKPVEFLIRYCFLCKHLGKRITFIVVTAPAVLMFCLIPQNQKHMMPPKQNNVTFATKKRQFLITRAFVFRKCNFFPPQFSGLYQRDKIVSAEFEWNLIVLLQRQGKDCISMKWAIDLSDESLAPRWACHAAQFL